MEQQQVASSGKKHSKGKEKSISRQGDNQPKTITKGGELKNKKKKKGQELPVTSQTIENSALRKSKKTPATDSIGGTEVFNSLTKQKQSTISPFTPEEGSKSLQSDPILLFSATERPTYLKDENIKAESYASLEKSGLLESVPECTRLLSSECLNHIPLSRAKKRKLRKKRIIESLGLAHQQNQGNFQKKRKKNSNYSNSLSDAEKTVICNIQPSQIHSGAANNKIQAAYDSVASNQCLQVRSEPEKSETSGRSNVFTFHDATKRVTVERKQPYNFENFFSSDTKKNCLHQNSSLVDESVNAKISELGNVRKVVVSTQEERFFASSNVSSKDSVSGLFRSVFCSDINLSGYSGGEVKNVFNVHNNFEETNKAQIEEIEKLLVLRSQEKKCVLKQESDTNKQSEVSRSTFSTAKIARPTKTTTVAVSSEVVLHKKTKEEICLTGACNPTSETTITAAVALTDAHCSLLENLVSATTENLSLQRNGYNGGPIYTSPNFENRVTSSADSNQVFSSNRNSLLVSSSFSNCDTDRQSTSTSDLKITDKAACSEPEIVPVVEAQESISNASGFLKCALAKPHTVETDKLEIIETNLQHQEGKPGVFVDETVVVEDCNLQPVSICDTIDTNQKTILHNTSSNIPHCLVVDGNVSVLQQELSEKDNSKESCVNSSTVKMNKTEKTRDEIKAEREAKKLAKQAKKLKTAVQPQPAQLPQEVSSCSQLEPTQKLSTKAQANTNLKLKDKKQLSPLHKPDDTTKNTAEESLQLQLAVSTSNPRTPTDGLLPFQKRKEDTETERKSQDSLHVLADTNASDDEKVKGMTNVTKQKFPSSKASENAEGKSKAELRAERRAKQEAQREAKHGQKLAATAATLKEGGKIPEEKQQRKALKTEIAAKKSGESSSLKKTLAATDIQHKVKLFNHLYHKDTLSVTTSDPDIHPAILQLGIQYKSRVIAGSNARCVALLHALKQVIQDYNTPPQQEFSRGLESCLLPLTTHLQRCRPLPVSTTNALRYLNSQLIHLPNTVSDEDAKKKLHEAIDTYIKEQIDVAGQAICNAVLDKITNGDTILIYGCSSLLTRILVKAHQNGKNFRVVVADGRPWLEGREMLRRLLQDGLQCSYVLLPAASFIMREVTKVLLGAHSLLANGYVMSRAGSSQIALLAHAYNVPVLVCCETHKFSERVQTDSFVYNEIGDPHELGVPGWREVGCLTPLNLTYDVTPPDLVTAVVTELSILPCTSVPVILRIKPSETGI